MHSRIEVQDIKGKGLNYILKAIKKYKSVENQINDIHVTPTELSVKIIETE